LFLLGLFCPLKLAETKHRRPSFSSMNLASSRKGISKSALLALFLLAFAKADAGPAAVLVDEFDAGLLNGAAAQSR